MFIVVSRWEILPGMDGEFEKRSRAVRDAIRNQSGITFMEGFRTEDGAAVAVVCYESRQAYDRVVNDAEGPFNKAVTEHRLEECAKWVRSERGDSID